MRGWGMKGFNEIENYLRLMFVGFFFRFMYLFIGEVLGFFF